MDYNELKSIIQKNKKKIKDAAKIAGYAENSWKVAYNDGTMSFSKVPLLCEFIGISPNEFYGWEEESQSFGNGNYASHISGGNTQNSNEAIKALKDQLKEKDKQIDRLLKIIEKNKLK
ncbi:MAG: hypothetical protein IJ057_06290 [Bacteroidales bacterium]|nr:hypothetical protein [Bacteroidales bacterium]